MVFPLKTKDAPVTSILQVPAQKETVELKTAKKPMFGNAISEAFYRLANNFFFEHRLYRVLDIAIWDDTTIYTFCNLWRIEKRSKGNAYFEYSLIKKAWFRMNPKKFPALKIIPLGDLSYQLLDKAGDKVLDYFEKTGVLPANKESFEQSSQFFIMKQIVRARTNFANKKGGSKILVKVLWNDLIDRTVFSQYCQVKPYRSSSFFNTYLHFYEHRKGLAKVLREHPNLMPLLFRIHARHWNRNDLFAARTWLIGREGGTKAASLRILAYGGLCSKAAFRWMIQAKRSTIRAIVPQYNTNLIENLVLSGAIIPDPVLRLACRCHVPKSQPYVQLMRLLGQECKRLKKELKTYEQRTNLVNQFIDLVQWLRDTGVEQGFPDKHSTWNSLLRRHEEWIEQLHHQSYENLTWSSPLEAFDVGRFTVKPLVSSDALYEEGKKMNHCIASYDSHCKDGIYLAFALHDKETEKDFTLGFCKLNQKKLEQKWEIDQIRSNCNGAASRRAINVGKEVLSLLNREEVVDSNRAGVKEI